MKGIKLDYFVIIIISVIFISCCAEVENEEQLLVRQDSAILSFDTLFSQLDSPIVFDSSFFKTFSKERYKYINNLDFFELSELKATYNGLPVSKFYAIGKFELSKSLTAYIIFSDMNDENPMDLYLMTASILIKNGKETISEQTIAKYHAYSNVLEECYVIIENDNIIQNVRFRGYEDGVLKIDSLNQINYQIRNNGSISLKRNGSSPSTLPNDK